MEAIKNRMIGLVCVLLMSTAVQAKEGIQFEQLTLEQALTKARKENKKVFIDIYATWCGPCKYLTNDVFTDESLGDFYNEHFVCIKIDGEKGEGPSVASRFDVDAYPTLLFLDEKGDLIRKKVGAGGVSTVRSWAKDVVHPEESRLYKLQKMYEAKAKPSKMVMMDYINALNDEGLAVDEVVAKYQSLHPDLNLEEEGDFLVFILSEQSFDDPLVERFLTDANSLEKIHGESIDSKIYELITIQMQKAVEAEDPAIVKSTVAKIYPAYKTAFQEEAFSQDVLEEKLLEAYASHLE